MLCYNFDKTIGLVTSASSFDQNLAILDANEHLNADSLAVAHDGYINVVPIINSTRRSKYLAIHNGSQRGSGIVKTIKWLQFKGETLFFVLSTAGVQIYDAEVTELRFFQQCKKASKEGEDLVCPTGVCTIENNFLCVGTSWGLFWLFSSNESNTNFALIDEVEAHLRPITFLDSFYDSFVSCCDRKVLFWKTKGRNFQIERKIEISGLTPSALKVSNGLALIGYESGEFCIFDMYSEKFCVREVAHRLKICSIDFSSLKYMMLTASVDSFVKMWRLDQHQASVTCVFSMSCEVPVCAIGLLNYSCTEFCVVKSDEISVDVYVEVCEENE